jgi:predicted metal-binding membrane protein
MACNSPTGITMLPSEVPTIPDYATIGRNAARPTSEKAHGMAYKGG